MKKTSGLRLIDLEKLASKTREIFQIEKDRYFPIYDIIIKQMEKGYLSFQILDDNDPIFQDGEAALYSAMDNFIYMKESSLNELEDGDYRHNFTLAHEYFHYLQNQVLNMKFIEVDTCPVYEDPEWQANNFAGMLLVPSEFLDLKEEEIAERFHVSIECALTRKVQKLKRNAYKEKIQ